ncbi:MAG TPA: CHAD domain-containing protein [Candidatus Sulfopaludibacter sp.]|nr:CHAD domain-containing protein [Candidatus Sulfopaludibacter sp.]
MDRDRLLKPVKKLTKLLRKMRRQPTPDEVHDLRTNARRFEAMFKAVALDARGMDDAALKSLDRLRKRAGKVRDLDVLTSYAAPIRPKGEGECQVQLLEHLGARRRKYAKKFYAEVKRRRPALRKDFKRTRKLLAKVVRADGDPAEESKAAADATGTAVKLAAELALPHRLGPENIHPYRLKVKELRDVLRMADGAARPKFIDDLGAVNDTIGEWHDWNELVSIAKKALKHQKGCGLMAELKRIEKAKYDRALSLAEALRRDYLREAAPKKKIPGPQVWQAASKLAG